MKRQLIPVIDSASGKRTQRSRDTQTMDVPADFDRSQGVASVDGRSRAHYVAADGRRMESPAFTRPLSWRAFGEECLVAASTTADGAAGSTGFRLCVIAVGT